MADDTEELLLDTQPDDDLDLDDDQDGNEQQAADQDEFGIEIEGEDAVEETPLVKQLRETARDAQRQLAEERKARNKPVEIGPKPTLESCEYDEDKFTADLEAWQEGKREAEQAARQQQEQVGNSTRQFERAVTNYRARAIAMKIPDIEGAERKVADSLGAEMTGYIVQYADDPAKLIAALSAHPSKLSQIADETDPLIRMKMLLKLEGQIKVTNRKAPPPPEAGTIQRGTVSVSATSDKRMQQLEAEATRTGDRTKLIAYKSQRARK